MAKNNGNKNNKNLHERVKKEAFDIKSTFIKYSKRYGITLLCAAPVMMIINYILSLNVTWYKGAVSFFISLAMLLFACLISMIIFNKIDEKKRSLPPDAEKERDPFAD